MCIVQFKKIQITYERLRFVSHVLWHAWWHAQWRVWDFDDIMISVTKQMEAAEANVCRECHQNDNEELRVIHRQWRLLSAWRAMLKLHLSLRTGSLRSWNDQRICSEKLAPQSTWSSDRISWFPATGSLRRKSWYCGSERYRQRNSLRMLLLLLLAATWIINL